MKTLIVLKLVETVLSCLYLLPSTVIIMEEIWNVKYWQKKYQMFGHRQLQLMMISVSCHLKQYQWIKTKTLFLFLNMDDTLRPYFTTGGNTHFLHQNSSENKVIVHVLCPWCRIKGPCVVFLIIIFIVYQARHNAMPALTANSVTLDEILEVRAGPLKEEELWAILSHSSEALQDVLIKGIAVKCSVFWGLIHQL